jgi:hypothetical protein
MMNRPPCGSFSTSLILIQYPPRGSFSTSLILIQSTTLILIQSGLNENAAQVRFSGRFNLLGVDLQPLTTQTVMAASCAALRRSLESAWFSDGRDNNRSKNKSKGNTNPFHGARTYES